MDPAPDAEPLPSHLARWTRELLGSPVPRERKATCDACAMCRPAGPAPAIATEYFDPRSKCCTFLPTLANFLVGRILADTTPGAARGRASVLERIGRGIAVSPLGLHRPADVQLIYEQGHELFGKAQALRCPHYLEDLGACGIWRHRESTCATWFCKHSRGAVGRRFWKSLHELMTTVEQQLACWCVLQLDVGNEALAALFPAGGERPRHLALDAATLDRVADRGLARRAWGPWHGRETELYERSAALVDGLSWARVLEICDPRVHALASLAREAFEALRAEALPGALRAGRMEQVGATREVVRVRTYSGLDPLDVPHAVLRSLGHFDGRPTEEVLRDLEERAGVTLDRGLTRMLVDFELLVPADAPRDA
jgi:hypothetical protein